MDISSAEIEVSPVSMRVLVPMIRLMFVRLVVMAVGVIIVAEQPNARQIDHEAKAGDWNCLTKSDWRGRY
jgi:hypothetical protein